MPPDRLLHDHIERGILDQSALLSSRDRSRSRLIALHSDTPFLFQRNQLIKSTGNPPRRCSPKEIVHFVQIYALDEKAKRVYQVVFYSFAIAHLWRMRKMLA